MNADEKESNHEIHKTHEKIFEIVFDNEILTIFVYFVSFVVK
jgi:hypothetical protein